MKQRILFAFFALSLFLTSCSSSDGLDGNWKRSSSFSGSERSGAVSFVMGEGDSQAVFMGTGYNGKDALKSFYKYSINKGWERIQDFPGEPRKDAVAFIANGKGYVGTGVDEDDNRFSDFYEYTPAVDADGKEIGTWNLVAITNFPGTKRQGAVAFSIGNAGYVGTGYGVLEGEDRSLLKDFYKYENGTWSPVLFDGEKSRYATSFVINEKAYVVSGEGSAKYVWEFDPSKGWTSMDYLDNDNNREDVVRWNAASFVINNKGYIVTGKNPGLSREVWEYNPTKDEWVERTSLEIEVSPRQDAIGFSINGKGFLATGYNGSYLGDMWEFEPTVKEDDDDN
jgi:N-acetylneuraminic acid mutarotase